MDKPDYGPGDLVVCIKQVEMDRHESWAPVVGEVYRCTDIFPASNIGYTGPCPLCGGTLVATVEESPPKHAYCTSTFRKAPEVNLEAWLRATKDQFAPKVLEPV